MARFLMWLAGWRATLNYKHRHPEVYKDLLQSYFPDDFTEAGPPCSA